MDHLLAQIVLHGCLDPVAFLHTRDSQNRIGNKDYLAAYNKMYRLLPAKMMEQAEHQKIVQEYERKSLPDVILEYHGAETALLQIQQERKETEEAYNKEIQALQLEIDHKNKRTKINAEIISGEIQKLQEKIPHLEQEVVRLREITNESTSRDETRIRKLEEQLENMRVSKETMTSLQQKINRLTLQNELKKKRLEEKEAEAKAKLIEHQDVVQKLQDLLEKQKTTTSFVPEGEDEMEQIKHMPLPKKHDLIRMMSEKLRGYGDKIGRAHV